MGCADTQGVLSRGTGRLGPTVWVSSLGCLAESVQVCPLHLSTPQTAGVAGTAPVGALNLASSHPPAHCGPWLPLSSRSPLWALPLSSLLYPATRVISLKLDFSSSGCSLLYMSLESLKKKKNSPLRVTFKTVRKTGLQAKFRSCLLYLLKKLSREESCLLRTAFPLTCISQFRSLPLSYTHTHTHVSPPVCLTLQGQLLS